MTTGAPGTRFRSVGRRSRARAGDPEAFAALYAKHEQELFRYCRSILRSDEDARDALQNAMVKAFTALQTERRDLALRPWLFRIAHNEAISLVRRRPTTTELDESLGGADDTVHRTVETRERLTHLRADLQDLPERQRGALVMRELSGLSHEEIGEALGTSARAVKQTLYEARCSLAECAEGRAMRCDEVQRALSDGDGRVSRTRRMRAHLRGCRSCERFRIALVERPVELAALSPVVPLLGASGVLAALKGTSVAAGVAGTTAGTAAVTAGAGGGFGATLFAAGSAKLVAVAATVTVAGGTAVVAGPSVVHRDTAGPPGTTTTAVAETGASSSPFPTSPFPTSPGAASGPAAPAGAGTPGRSAGAGGPGTRGSGPGTTTPGGAAKSETPGPANTKEARDAAKADRATARTTDGARATAAKTAKADRQARSERASKRTPAGRGAAQPARRTGAASAGKDARAARAATKAKAAKAVKSAATARRARAAKDAAQAKAARDAQAAKDAAAVRSGSSGNVGSAGGSRARP